MSRTNTVPGTDAGPRVMSRVRILLAYVAQARYELLHSLRSPQMVLFTVLFPMMFYVLVGIVFGPFRHPDPDVRLYVLIGFITMAVMTPGFSSFSGVLALERETGLYTLRRALPMPTGADMFAKMVTVLMCVSLVVPVLIVMGRFLGHVELAPRQTAALWVLSLFGALPFCALGSFIGMYASARAVPAIVNLLMIPMLYLSGALFPLPDSLAWLSRMMPPFYLQQLMLAAAGAPHRLVMGTSAHIALLLGVTATFALLTLRRFRMVG
ncbi:MAG TPA: ABC transporter permease [Vicinamibacterales bacterium]